MPASGPPRQDARTPPRGLTGVVRTMRRGARFLRPLAGHLATLVLLALTTIAGLVAASLWLGFRVVWDLIGQGSVPAPWELALLGVAPQDGPSLRAAIASAAAPRLVLLSTVGAFAAVTLGYYAVWILQRVNHLLRLVLFERYQRLSLRFHADSRVGDLIYRLYQDSAMVTQVLEMAFVQPLLAFGTFVIGVGVLALLAPPYVLAPLLTIPLAAVLVRVASGRLRTRFRRAREAQSDLTACVQEAALGIRAVKAYGNEAAQQRRFEDASQRALHDARAARGQLAVFNTLLFLPLGAAAAAVALFATERAAAAPPLAAPVFGMTAFGLAAYGAAKSFSGMAVGSIRAFAGLWARGQDTVVGLDRTFEVLDRVPDVEDAPGATPLAPFAHEVALRDVSFAYEPGAPVLRGVSLVARRGEVIAIAGPTGAGKSTLLALVPRLFDPDAGAVLVDGRDVREATVRSVRAQTAIVLQEHVLFGATVRENLLYGRPDASEAELRAAAELACADEFIGRLPAGYETLLGERGTKLSTGQRQRLGITRALLRNAPILLLDEPTASLDAPTELRVLRQLRTWAHDRCVLLVTHRISTIRHADRVVFLEGGRIVEHGTHEQLLALPGGRYRAFVEAHRSPAGAPPDPPTAGGPLS